MRSDESVSKLELVTASSEVLNPVCAVFRDSLVVGKSWVGVYGAEPEIEAGWSVKVWNDVEGDVDSDARSLTGVVAFMVNPNDGTESELGDRVVGKGHSSVLLCGELEMISVEAI